MLASVEEFKKRAQTKLESLKKGDLFNTGGFQHFVFVEATQSKGLFRVVRLNKENRLKMINSEPITIEVIDLSEVSCLNVE